MKISEFLDADAVIPQLGAKDKPGILKELAGPLARHIPVPAEKIFGMLSEREEIGTTGIGEGVAIPHGKLSGVPRLTASFGVAHQGVDFQAIDNKPTFLFFALIAPENSAGLHLKALARISRLFKSPAFREAILKADGAAAIYALITREDDAH
jgi:PTS system nitrogen regulatory IIA component